MSSRREFLTQAVSASSALLLGAVHSRANGNPSVASKSLHILILGGTGFIGPHYVRTAVGRGHQVSVFNRGKSEAALPTTVERLVGDRNRDLESIKHRDWDAVVDLATYGPGWVRSLGEALKDRVNHYTFISTAAVYDHPAANDKTSEDSPVLAYQGSADPYSLTASGGHYGALKVLCEREAEKQFPSRTLILRPGYIVGPGDPQGYLTYWPVRMENGGEILAAGDPSMPIQFIDARDLAEWAIRMIEKSATGIYNTVGPAALTSFGQMVNVARDTASASPMLTWVPSSWLAAQKDRELWLKLLFWSFESEGFAAIMRMSIERALANGLTTRPMSVTLVDTFEWYKKQPVERQAELLSRRKKKENGTGFDVVAISWPTYLEREKEILATWHAQQVAKKGLNG